MNNYHIYEQQAKGKYSVIFKARKKKRLQFVAIKRLQKTRKPKVYNQAQILSQLNHPNIIKFYDYMQTKNHMWEITQYCPGGDLLKIVEYDKQLPQNTVRGFILQIMSGLQYSHSKGIIVCDIKPACILANQYGNVKLGDFGSAQRLVDLMGKSKGKKKGTPSYMAPQLFQVNGVYSFQSDLWALGCMMYQLGQGNPPFVSTNFQQIAQLAKKAATPKIDNFSSDFNNLLSRLLQKDPINRIQWAQIIKHPWIKHQLPQLQIPQQTHFLQYIRQRTKPSMSSQKLRISHNFQNQNYGLSQQQNMTASNRRQVFEFQNYNQKEYQEEDYQKEEFDDSDRLQDENMNTMMNVQVNMKKNKAGGNQKQQGAKNNNNKIGSNNKVVAGNANKITNQKPLLNQKQNNNPLQDSSNINLFLQTLTSKPTMPIQQAISHQSDSAVKPIIGNKDIQLIQSINFNKNQLGFSYIEPQILAQGILNHQMDNQLKKILDGMKGEDKINVLGYFQTIVQNSQVANQLFKSNYIPYYMSLLKSYKQSALRANMCQVLGLLIRHATSIDSDILKYGIISGFVQAVTKDKSQKVRRKAMAALGQLLFYGATQVDQDAMQWDIPLSLISTLLKILKNNNEDQIVRIYCCKSIENITAQAQKVGLNFSQIDTLIVMIGCFNSTKNQGFRTSIMSSIHHMISLNQTLRQIFLQKMPLPSIIQVFNDSQVSPKTIQIILWIYLTQLSKNPKSKQSKLLLQNKELIKSILSMIQSSSSVVKGRVYLFIYFILNNDFKKIHLISQSKLFHSIQRHGKQSGKYQSQALQFVVAILYQNFHSILKLCCQQLQFVVSNNSSQVDKNNYMIVICQMQSCQIFEQLFSCQQNVQFQLNIMNLIDFKQSIQKPYIEHFKNQYYMILQKIFTNQSTTQKLQQYYSSTLLPFLIGKILKTHQNDIRYSCIKYIINIIKICLSQQYLYDSTILTQTNTKIQELIINHLIPHLDILFNEEEIVSNNILFKLLSELFAIKQSFIWKYWKVSDIHKFINFVGENSTIHILKTIELLFLYKLNNNEQINKYHQIVSQFWIRTIQLLRLYKSSGQQLFLQYPLSILANILTNHSYIKINQIQIDSIFQQCVVLQSHEDPLVRTKAQNLINILLQNNIYSQKGIKEWKQLSKKGLQNYQLFTKISGIKGAPTKQTNQTKNNNKQSRYNY